MMGNESSQLSGLEVEKKAIEVLDSWTLHSATVSSGNIPMLCVFISNSCHLTPNLPSLEIGAKNLMLHRHPCILKYVSSWNKNGKFHLATEKVTPLSQLLADLTPLQICIGLYGILKALIFLHEKALASHNNVCCAAIYVSTDGTWKLGGLEYLCRFSKLTHSFLQQTKGTRYEKAVAPEEASTKPEPGSVDTFAFGVFAEEVLQGQSEDFVPGLTDFREMCRVHLQNREPKLRPSLNSLLSHQFFMHDFIRIHSFLLELPLKSDPEKQAFFRSLSEELTHFPEELVASQLSGSLLSRLVILDQTAQDCLLPQVLSPKEESEAVGLFSVGIYRQYIVPRLLQMICVRDAQVRLLLLSHFTALCRGFSQEQLQTHVLPELLVGIKDTSDKLVSVTLRALADLVPLLGAAVVIGGKRGKLFTDGRPKVRTTSFGGLKPPTVTLPTHVATLDQNSRVFADDLPERPSPDGGEDHATTTDEELEPWSDWDAPESHTHETDVPTSVENAPAPATLAPLPDISTLDIKHSSGSSARVADEFDFFRDMEPVICKTRVLHVEDGAVRASKSRFDVTVDDEDEVVGWGDDLEDWGEVVDNTQPSG